MRSILVTGAGRGIGREFVRQFLARGDRVFAALRAPSAGRLADLQQAHPDRLTLLDLDVADLGSIAGFAGALARHGEALDLLVNNAGVLPDGERFGSVVADDLERSFRVNAAAPFLLTQALAPMLARGTQPRVANLSSELGSIARRAGFGTPSYCISKAALNMVTRLQSLALAPLGIGCVALHPGWVKTDMGGAQAPLEADVAVRGMIAVIDALQPTQYGGFYAYDGSALPW